MKLKIMRWINHWYWILTDWKKKFNSISLKRSHKGRWSVEFPSMKRRRTVVLHDIIGIPSTLALFFTNLLFPAGGAFGFYSALTWAFTTLTLGGAAWGASSLLGGQKKAPTDFSRGSLLFSTMTVKDVTYNRDSTA